MTSNSNNKFRAVDITFVGMFAALMAIGANITAWAPFLQVAGVPLTMQTFFAILAGLLLGSRLGAISMLVYMLVGLAGAPVFAGFDAGLGAILGSSGGFILSFIPCAYFAGKIIESAPKPALHLFFLASFIGLITNYFIGTNYMYIALNYWLEIKMDYLAAWKIMGLFIIKDVTFTIFVAIISPRIYFALNRNRIGRGIGSSKAS